MTHDAARHKGRRCVPVSTPQFQCWTVSILCRLTGGECGCVVAEIIVRIFLLLNEYEGHGLTRMLDSIACDVEPGSARGIVAGLAKGRARLRRTGSLKSP